MAQALTLAELDDSFALAIRQRTLLEAYIRDRLKPDKHYYTVAAGQKPSLTKDGAEVICLPHGYKPQYTIVSGPDQPPNGDDTPYQITIKCRLRRGESFEGEGIGSASSHITKRDGTRAVRQTDIGLRHNSTLKMASKSAYIAATLNATAASEFFTQDMEDMVPVPRGGSPAKTKVTRNSGGGMCPDHNQKWFKSQSMRGYAHPMGEGEPWCNKPTAKEAPPAAAPAEQAEGERPVQARDIYEAAEMIYGKTKADVMNALNLEEGMEIKDVRAAWTELERFWA